MSRKRRTAGRSRRWCAVFGGIGAAGIAAVLAGVIAAPAGRADGTVTLINILGQADTNMTEAADTLFGIPTDSLSTNAASALSDELSFDFWARSAILSEESLQESLSGAAADNSRLILLDKDLVVETTLVLANDQTDAGDPASAFEHGVNAGMLLDDFHLASAIVDVDVAGIEVKLLDVLGLSEILQF